MTRLVASSFATCVAAGNWSGRAMSIRRDAFGHHRDLDRRFRARDRRSGSSRDATTLPAGFTADDGDHRPEPVRRTSRSRPTGACSSPSGAASSRPTQPRGHERDRRRGPAHQGPSLLRARAPVARGRPRLPDPNPYIYVYYNLDAKIGGTPPLYGTAGATYDDCKKATRQGRELHRRGARRRGCRSPAR